MKITHKILSIPPYISTSWSQVRALYLRENDLVVSLADGVNVSIPNLTTQDIEAIFNAHASFSERVPGSPRPGNPRPQQEPLPSLQNSQNPQFSGFRAGQNPEGMTAMHFNLDNMEAFGSALQHNSEQASMPNLPDEIISKIAAIAKIVAPGEIQNLPKPEPHCNCPHCQIARAIHGMPEKEHPENSITELKEEEIIEDRDLSFQQWDINQTGDKLYVVTNRLDTNEKYNVYLGQPVGCTCGHSGCEHILAVLKS